MSAYSYSSSKSKLKYGNAANIAPYVTPNPFGTAPDSTSSGAGLGSTRLSLGSYDIGSSSRFDTSTSSYGRTSPRLDSLTSRLDSSPSRFDRDLDTTSSYRSSRYASDTAGSSRLERASKYSSSLEDSGTSKYDRSSRYSITEDLGTSRLDRASRYSVTGDDGVGSRYERKSRYSITEGDSDTGPSRYEYKSRYATESSDADISPYRRESRTSTSKYLTDASDLDTGSSRYERSSRLLRGTSELSDTGSASKWDTTRTASRSYAIETLDTETPSSERYEQRLLAELELDASRWDRTPSRYTIESPDLETDYSRLDKRSSRLTSVTSETDDTTKYDRSSRYVSELDTGPSKWESEYESQYKRWDATGGSSRLDRQSSKMSTDSEVDTGLSRYDSRTTRVERQSSRSSDVDIDSSSHKKSSKLETIQSYGLITDSTEDQFSDSGLVRTTSGILRTTVRRESEPESDTSSTPAKPRVKKTIKSISQPEGQKATLECEISGYPRPAVQWLKENEVISSHDRFETGSEGNRFYLIINDLRPEDVGLYTVAATNNLGTSTSSAAINVLPAIHSPTRTDSRPTSPGGTFLPTPPKFKVKLKDTELMDGTTVRFELVVRGMPIPTVTFYKDDKVLKEDNRVKVLFESKEVFELMIEHVTEKDQGFYKCVAINSEGKDETSGRITISKNKILFPGIEDEPPLDFTKADSLSPRSRSGSPVFKWFKDGKEFEASERFQVQFDDDEDTITLVFQHVKPEDAGLYTCAASTSSGKISCSAELTVQGLLNQLPRDPIPPTIKLAMADVEVSEGASAMLEAKVAAFPRPVIRWYRGKEQIEAGERYKFLYEDEESYTLVIKNIRKEDQGLYRIEAVNDLGSADTSANLTVNVAPKFKKQMKDVSVMTDEVLKLEVDIDATPAPDVKWFKDGQQIKEKKGIKIIREESHYEMIIEKVKVDDSGSYSCVASNELGQQTSYSVVTINAPPRFASKLESTEALEGEKAEMSVRITGNPKPSIKFWKDEKVFKDDGKRIRIVEEDDGTCRLIINKSDSSDSGKYKVTASNEWGEEASEAELTVKRNAMKPNFVKKLRDFEEKVGDQMIELNVKVEGIPIPEIKWFREGLEIKEKDGFKFVADEANQSYTLVIKEVKAESAGTYKCEASNSEGSAQTSGVFTVNTPPQFVKKLSDKTVNENENVKLEVKVSGTPSPDVKWFKDEVTIKSSDKRLRYEEDSNEYTLILNDTSADDSAVYKVVAENVFGKCETKGELKVTAKTTKPVFTQLLSDKQAVEMQTNVEFVVKTDSQVSKPMIKWFIDEKEITERDKRYQLIADEERNTYKLVIKTATDETVGRYKCTATNSSGTADTSAKFNIVTKPKFIKGLDNVEANEGETVSLTVKVQGTPEPEVKFLRDGKDVSTEATIVVKKEIDDIYVMEIENIKIVMSGQYQCHIKNEAGEAFSNGTIVVNSKPKFVKDLEDTESWANENIVLEVKITGSPTPEITWYKDGKKVEGTERVVLQSREELFQLKVDQAAVEDTGVYKCRARNKSGETESKEAKVKVKEADTSSGPVFVKRPADQEVVIDDSARFEAKVEGKPKPDVVWTKNGVELKPSSKIIVKEEEQNVHLLILKDLQVKDSGDITCKAQNSKGQASEKARLLVQEPKSPTFESFSDVAVVEESPARLEAKISGIPKPTVTWYKDGSPVNEDLVFSEPENNLYSLRFKSVTEDLVGKYMCNASNVAGDAQQSADLSISGSKPKFIRELQDEITMSVEKDKGKIILGQNAVFEAEISGNPAPDVVWLKNGKEMVPNDRTTINNVDQEYTCEVKSVTRDDVAQYVCKATNVHGEVKSVCLLKYQDTPHPPIVKKELPKTVSVEEGTQLLLTAQVDGEPIPSTEWSKNGKPISQSDDIKIINKADGVTQLVIDSVTPADKGQYELKAINLKGETTTSTAVTIAPPQRKPTFDKELAKQVDLEEGQPLQLSTKVDALPSPEVKWIKDGTPLKTSDNVVIEQKPDGTQTLKIKSTKSQDSGVYTIRATNTAGQTSCSSTVHISLPQIAPVLEKQLPKSLSIEEGKPLELEAIIKAEPIAEVLWKKDGVEIQASDVVSIETKPDGTHVLRKAVTEVKDTGKYMIVASNPLGKVTSETAVEIKPSKADKADDYLINKLPEVLRVVEGDSLSLTAKVDGKPKEVQWTKDGKPIRAKDGVKVVTKDDGTIALVIDCAKAQDAGQYAVIAKTSKGEVVSSSDVNVSRAGDLMAPEVKPLFPKEVEVLEGKPLVLTAKVEGQPLPSVKWLKDDLPVQRSDSVQIETKPDGTVELTVNKSKAQDSGKYTLIVENTAGEVRASADVDVQKQPIISDKLPEKMEVVIDKPMELIAKVDGSPMPKVEWTKDGVPVKEGHGVKVVTKPDGTVALSVDTVKPDTAGEYAMIVKSPTGDIVTSSKVDVQKGPVFVDKLPDYVDVIVGKALKLAAKVLADTKPEVKWTKDGVPIKESETTKIETKPDGTVELSISSAQPTDTGRYAVIAKNVSGEAMSQSDVDVQHGPIFREPLPESLKVIEGKPIDLFARVDGNPRPEVIWTKDGVTIEAKDGVVIKSKPDGAVSLLVESAQPSDVGQYAATARSPLGEVVSATDVDVQKGPILKELLPQFVNITEGQPLELVAKSEGTPIKSVEWAKDGKPIKATDGVKIETTPSGNICLTIDKAQVADAGKYELLVKTPTQVLKTSSDVNVAKSQTERPTIRPEFAKVLDVVEGKPLVLAAKIVGQPLPSVKWLKDDVVVQVSDSVQIETKPDGSVELRVDKALAKDSGVYTLVAENEAGEVRASSAVDVQKGPVICQKLPAAMEVVVGKPLILTAKVEGVPQSDVNWTKDGVPLKATDGVKVESKPDGTVAVSVDKARLQDAGDYALVIKSPTGDIVSSSKVDIQKGPVIVEKLPDYLDVIVGQPIVLKAKVDGLPAPIVKWIKEGIRVEPSDAIKIETQPDGTTSLTVVCAQPHDLGKYVVIAKNSIGEAVSECGVDVQTGPIIREKLPETLLITEGKPFELIAKVDGSPLPEVSWMKDGVVVEPMEGIEIKSKPDGTVALSISEAQSDDTGRYALIAKSPSGQVVTKSEVDVRKGPIIKECLPEYVKIDEGQTLQLVARVEGEPITEVKWAKDGVPLAASDKIVIESKPNGNIVLSIASAKPSDAGKYALVVKTSDQDLTTASDVDVVKSNQKSPEIVEKLPQFVDAVEGKPLILTAKVEALPKAEIQWLKDDLPIQKSKSVKLESKPDGREVLTIDKSEPKDAGKYTMIAENPLGVAKTSSDVDVRKGVAISQKLPDIVDVVVGKPLTLTAKVDGKPDSVQWTKNGVPITAGDGIKIESRPDGTVQLCVDKARPEDTGHYAVVAKSPAGEVSSDCNVDVLTGPAILGKLPESVDVIVGQQLKLVAKVDAQQSPLIKWMKDDIRVEPSDHIKIESNPDGTVSLTIDCAQINDTGKYAIVVKTRDGEDSSSSNVFVQKGPVIVEGLPDSISLIEGKPLNLTAKIEGKPSPEVTWYKDNVPIKASDEVQIKSKPDGTVSLTIGSAKGQDSGEYAVIAKSPTGEAMSLSNVEVKKGPVFIQKLPEEVKVIAGNPINLVAKIDGLPQEQPKPPMVSWVKDGYPVVFTEKVKLGTKPNGTLCLSIDCAKAKDAGKYAVIAKTPEGEIVSTTAVSVLNAPTFKDSLPKTLTVVEGKPLRLCAKYESDSVPEITWTKDGVAIKAAEGVVIKSKPDGTAILEISNAQLADSGQYAVLAKTPAGQAKSACDVAVQRGLVILENLPHSVSVCEGRPLHLSAKIDGKPPPEVTWIKDGIPIKQAEGVEIRSKPDGTYMLTIGATKGSDSGEYVMIARTPGEEVVAVTNVDVEKGPVIREKLPERVNVIVGKPLELCAKIESDTPIDKIIWTKDGVPIRPSGEIKLKQRPDGTVCLSIDCAKLSDAGKYAVFAKVGTRGVGSMSVVTVEDKPKEEAPQEEKGEPEEEPEEEEVVAEIKDKLPKTLIVTEGEPLKLVAKIARKGDKIPEFKWTKNGNQIEDSDRIRRETTPTGTVALKIDSALLTDGGTYKLSFKTADGFQTTTVAVQVNPKSTIEQPVFIKGLSRVTTEEAKPCRLEAKVSGDIESVTWYRNGDKISADEHFGFVRESDGTIALLIDATKAGDSGEYKVEVTNKAGKADSSATLKVTPKPKEKPVFIEELKPTIVNERERLVLKAVFKSDLPVKVKWVKDGFDIEAGNRIQLQQLPDGTVTLTIESAKLDDTGKYSVSIINDEGRIRSTGAVSVSSKVSNIPEFVEGLTPTTLTAGETGKLSVKASGEPTPEVRFIKDGQQVIPNDRVHIKGQMYGKTELVFDEVRPEDEGNYIAIAVNDSGEARSSAPVIVNRSPKFEKQLTDTTGVEGFPAKLEVKVDGRPKPDIKWMKNGVTIRPDDQHIKLYAGGDGTHCLMFDNCGADDSGEYKAIASNEFGKSETCAQFTVKTKGEDLGPDSAPVIVRNLQDVSAYEGQTIELTAEIKANPIPELKWYFNNELIQSSDNIQMTFDGTKAVLKIAKCDSKHKGVYELKVSNGLGDASSKATATVLGKSAPKFVEKFAGGEFGLSEQCKLTCRVTGFPEPEVHWYCNGIRVEPGLHYSIIRSGEVCSLLIVRATDKMSGAYECRAVNECGTDSCKANITFVDSESKGEKASFFKKLNDCEARAGTTAKLTACVTGSPRPEIKWFKNGVEFDPLSSASNYTLEYQSNGLIRLEIHSVEESDLGEYRCHALNIHGYDNSLATLKFESLDDRRRPSTDKLLSDKFKQPAIPVPLPDRPRITKMSDQGLTLWWMPSIPIQPRIPVTYIIEFMRIPDGEWVAYRTGIKDCQCDVDGLSPGEDYSFRTRVENKFGISDPSPAVTAHRSKLKPSDDLTKAKPKDYDIKHKPMDKQECAPMFMREHELYIYGIRGQPVTLEFWIYAHPDAAVVWKFEGEKIITGAGSRFDTLNDRGGQNCLFISKMTEEDVGWYTIIASNKLGTEERKVKLEIAEPPLFTKRFEETTVLSRKHARFECSVIGKPEPVVRWFKDWQPMAESDRIKILWESPDRATLFINGAIVKDSGLYSCSASNIAGHAQISAMLHIEESELEYEKYSYGYHSMVKPKTKQFEAYYDIGDELGRGTQGITYHSVERSTGKSFATKMMHGHGKMKDYMTAELDIMNQLGYHPRVVRLWDAFTSTPNSMTLISDLCGGGELLHHIIQKGSLTESEVALYIRQILEGLDYLHFRNIAHFGLTIGDILLERLNGTDIKIADFGLAQRVIPGLRYLIEFGHPEFVAPEILDKQSASYVSDVWSVGIITYILLTGISPFLGENDRATLQHLQLGKIDFSHEMLTEVSPECRDFLTKVLEFDQYKRIDVKTALQHPWLRELAEQPGTGQPLRCIDNLRQYQKRWKSWYANASCRTHYRRRTLHSCFTHPSRMIYPPDEVYTPPPSPEREVGRSKFKPSQFDETMKQRIAREGVDAHSESQYTAGPDTYLLQLRDTDFATRIRSYLRVGASRSPSLAASLRESHWGDTGVNEGYKPSVSVRERRKFTDIMDEEVGEEKRGLETRKRPMRLVREVGTSGYAYGQLSTLKKEAFGIVSKDTGIKPDLPFFREKIKDIVIRENEDVVFSCFAVGNPTPSYTWFRNDGILIESSRIEVKRTDDGRCELRIKPARAYDVGHYKCVARNEAGAVVCRARLKLGDTPGAPDPPEVKCGSNKEIYLCWSPPRHDGNAHVLCYRLESQLAADKKWKVIADNIMHEFYIVKDLEPDTSHHFRVTARNRFGWGAHSNPSEAAKTQASEEAQRLSVPRAFIIRQTVTEDVGRVVVDDQMSIPMIDYSKELNPIPLLEGEHSNLYEFLNEISRGRFSIVTNTRVKDVNRILVTKAVLTQSELESGVEHEYQIMKSLANERIAELHYASRGSSLFTLVMEKLSGIDVLTFLSQRQRYSEEIVAKIVIQVLDAIEYLHFRDICLLELQPDNVVMVDQRRYDIKLCDFANARRVPAVTGTRVSINASLEYVSPEVVKNEEVTTYADIWCVGVLTYILLSGVSPFRGSDDNETAQNVVYVRYMFDHLYPEITQEAMRFILTVFKLTPHKRPTIEECTDHKWLLPNEFIMKKRESAVFSSRKITEFADQFHAKKSSATPSRLINIAGNGQERSVSTADDSTHD